MRAHLVKDIRGTQLAEAPCDFCGEPLGTFYLRLYFDTDMPHSAHVHERCLERYKTQLIREVLTHNAHSR